MASNAAMYNCRMYEAKYPEVDDLVMVNVRSIADMGAYVQLLEYNNIEGMILLSELSRRRIRSIQKLIRVGRNEVVVVLRVDKEKGYIDLSKRRVSVEDIEKCEEKYNKSKSVHSIIRHVAEKTQTPTEELYQSFGWPLYRKFGHALDAFRLAVAEPDKVFEGLTISDAVKEELVGVIRRRLAPQATKIRADIEVTCFAYDGIDAVKAALLAGEACSTDVVPMKIRLIAPPLYIITTQSLDKAVAIERMEHAISVIEQTIKASKGEISVKMKPRAVDESDEVKLAALMERVGKENEEVSGDEDDEDGEDGAPAADPLAGEAAPAAAAAAAPAAADDEDDDDEEDDE